MLFGQFWRNKKILVTGHTGFIGGWLCFWLSQLGAEVTGYALDPDYSPNFSMIAQPQKDIRGDIRHFDGLQKVVDDTQPDIIFHLAAQALVRKAYHDPLETYETNVMGTANLMQAARQSKNLQAMVIFTTDKVYDNQEQNNGYREDGRLGGKEPYGNSKACCELVTQAFYHSYFKDRVGVATVRAGNVVGGGDWSDDRLVPDAIRAFAKGEKLLIRNPLATRPWQHVLEPCYGLLLLGQKLCENKTEFSRGWNLGPDDDAKVEMIADLMCRFWGDGAAWEKGPRDGIYEAKLLSVDPTQANRDLGWRVAWDLETGLQKTVEWYKSYYNKEDMVAVTAAQIQEYLRAVEGVSHDQARASS